MIGVVNASPLIYLGKIGRLNILPKIFSEVWTSKEVKLEVLSKDLAPEIPLIEQAFNTWLKLYKIKNDSLKINLLKLNIHLGEASIIASAYELKQIKKEAIAIIDDLTAREIARTFNIPVIGTVGILLRSVKDHLLTKKQYKNHLEFLLEETSFRITPKLYFKILKKLEELQ